MSAYAYEFGFLALCQLRCHSVSGDRTCCPASMPATAAPSGFCDLGVGQQVGLVETSNDA